MLYYLDTEFIEDGHTIDLISIGLVAEDGREYYALHYGCDYKKANDWVKQNVLSNLPPEPLPQLYATTEGFKNSISYKQGWRNKDLIAEEILEFINDDPQPEFWGEYCAHDWIALTQLFGPLIEKPEHFPWHCNDVIQYRESFNMLYVEDWPESLETDGNHNALLGARTVKARWGWCEEKRKEQRQDLMGRAHGAIR